MPPAPAMQYYYYESQRGKNIESKKWKQQSNRYPLA